MSSRAQPEDSLRERILDSLNRTYYPGKLEITLEDAPYVADTLVALYRESMLAALSEKRKVDWQNISTPELVAKQSEAYGWNQAIDAMSAAIARQCGEEK